VIFVPYELFGTYHPVVHLRVFKIRTYGTGVLLMTILGLVLYGSLVLLPIFLQTLLGYPALQAGFAMAPRGLGSFIAMPLVGAIIARFDPRKLLALGVIVASFTLWELSRLNLNAGYWDVFWPQFIQGISLGFLFVPLTTTTMDPIPREEMGNATSIFNLMRNLGGSMGIASVTTTLARRQQIHIDRLGANINSYNLQAQMAWERMRGGFMTQGADLSTAGRRAYGALFGVVQRQAAMLSFIEAFWLLSLIFLVILPLILLMKRPGSGGRGMAAH